jgi:hypothetical protein
MRSGMDEKIYPERKMLVGVALGGPLAGGYYFWRTLNAFQNPRGAVIAVVVAVLVLVIIFGCGFIPGLDRIPNVGFYGLQFGLVYGVTRGYLLTEMTGHMAEGKPVYGWGNTLLVALISMVLTLGPLVGLIYLTKGLFGADVKYYGRLRHEIVYDSSNLSEIEVGQLAAALTSAGFFDEAQKKTVDAEKKPDGRFIITMYCSETARDNAEFLELCKKLRSDVQKSFPMNPIVIDLVVDTPQNRIARLE